MNKTKLKLANPSIKNVIKKFKQSEQRNQTQQCFGKITERHLRINNKVRF